MTVVLDPVMVTRGVKSAGMYYEQTLSAYITEKMNTCAPNTAAFIGEMVGARRISHHAGSLTNISTINTFMRGNTPTYGLISNSSVILRVGANSKDIILSSPVSPASSTCAQPPDTLTIIILGKLDRMIESTCKNGMHPGRGAPAPYICHGGPSDISSSVATSAADGRVQRDHMPGISLRALSRPVSAVPPRGAPVKHAGRAGTSVSCGKLQSSQCDRCVSDDEGTVPGERPLVLFKYFRSTQWAADVGVVVTIKCVMFSMKKKK
eukprot:735965_1